jgi:hypothetical protein
MHIRGTVDYGKLLVRFHAWLAVYALVGAVLAFESLI